MALPQSSPWGKVQAWENIAEGIDFANTAGHGGIKLSRQRQAAMPDALRLPGGWYEEDVEYNRVVLVFPEAFKPEQVESAHRVIKNYNPDEYQAWSGKKLTAADSETLAQREFKERHKNDYIALAAWGDWHEKVPKGFVGVFAGRGGRRGGEYPPDCKTFLVPAEEYRNTPFGFVIDPIRHQEVPNF